MMRWLFPLLSGALFGSAVMAAEVKERTTYFTVRGTTLEELDRDLGRKGPLMSETGVRHPGSTQVKFDGRVTYRETPNGLCRVERTNLGVHLVKTLPKWSTPRSATPQTRIVWKTLSDDIARHEADHARIAKLWLKKMDSALKNLASEPTCDAMEARVEAVTATYLANHERAQRDFDTIEGREMNMRLRRLLKANIREAATQ
jgi:predicted secreted Zn-dependent protease